MLLFLGAGAAWSKLSKSGVSSVDRAGACYLGDVWRNWRQLRSVWATAGRRRNSRPPQRSPSGRRRLCAHWQHRPPISYRSGCPLALC